MYFLTNINYVSLDTCQLLYSLKSGTDISNEVKFQFQTKRLSAYL